jgi:tryptophan synthase alpha chain
MNNLIKKSFKKGLAFIGYITAGDGGMEYTEQAALALVQGGVDILEIGIPFSDPIADGPIIQRAMQRSLQNNTTVFSTLELISKLKQKANIPIILFSYYNPILAAHQKGFFQQAQAAGVDAILIVDLPLEESSDFQKKCNQYKINNIAIITPTTPLERIKKIDQQTDTFLYYACRAGITGMRDKLPEDFSVQLKKIKTVADNPIAVGFGISNQAMAKEILNVADGFVIGSRFMQAIEQNASPQQLQTLAESLDPR